MKAFLVRSIVILILFFTGALLASLTNKPYLALVIWLAAIVAWTLRLGFRQSMVVTLPFLLLADILWDGTIGSLFLFGFLLAALTTYLEVRIEAQSRVLQISVYSVLTALFATLVVAGTMFWSNQDLEGVMVSTFLGIFFAQLVVAIIFFLAVSRMVNWVEEWLDNSHYEQSKKIR